MGASEVFYVLYLFFVHTSICETQDSANLFNVSFHKDSSSIKLQFKNESKAGTKEYVVKYGPITPECKHLPYEISGNSSNSSLLWLKLSIDLKDICYHVTVHNGIMPMEQNGNSQTNSSQGFRTEPHSAILYIAGVTVIICILLLIMNALAFYYLCERIHASKSGYHYKSSTPEVGHVHESITPYVTQKSGTVNVKNNVTEDKPLVRPKSRLIDLSTTWYKLLKANKESSTLYKFCKEKLPDAQLHEGFGYLRCDVQNNAQIQDSRRVIEMDEANEQLPKYMLNMSAAITWSRERHGLFYIQERKLDIKLSRDDYFLYCVHSKVISTKSYWRLFDVTHMTKETTYLKERMPGYSVDWIRYGYFEFCTMPEYIHPTQGMIVLKKSGELVKGQGIRHLLGATGDGSEVTLPPKMADHPEWECIFIQSNGGDRFLTPNTRYLFCADLFKIDRAVYRTIHDVSNASKLRDFGRQVITGYKPEIGYGYYEFTQEERLKTHRNVIMIDMYGRLFTGPGAKFFYTGCEYGKDELEGRKKISPPDLSGTAWKHIFIQGHDGDRLLQPGTKFLYCEYRTPLV